MTLDAGTYEIGPELGTVRLFTTREGLASAVGHDLQIEFGRWSGTLEVAADPGAASVTVRVELDSFTVVTGTGGVSPLSDSDRADIRKNALKVLAVDRTGSAEFRSQEITVEKDGAGELLGTLTVAEGSAAVRFEVSATGPRAWRATGEVAQTALGIKPYRAFLGALRLSDTVRIEVEVDLDSGET